MSKVLMHEVGHAREYVRDMMRSTSYLIRKMKAEPARLHIHLLVWQHHASGPKWKACSSRRRLARNGRPLFGVEHGESGLFFYEGAGRWEALISNGDGAITREQMTENRLRWWEPLRPASIEDIESMTRAGGAK